MRTTLTLDADVARALNAAVKVRKMPFKTIVNESLRAGLGMSRPAAKRARFQVTPHDGGFAPGIDPRKLGKLAADLEDDGIVRRLLFR